MRLARRVTLVALVALAVDVAVPVPAFAYLDPGAGSLVFQWIIAGVVGAALAARVGWRRFSGVFRRKGQSAADVDD